MTSVPYPRALTNKMIVTNSQVREISGEFIAKVNSMNTITSINLSGNQIERIAKDASNLKHVSEMWLASNAILCDCGMTWMIPWLNNFTTPAGTNIIKDYKQVKCTSGRFKGIPVHVLTDVAMGCYPHKWTTGQIVGVALAAVFLTILFAFTIFVMKRSRELKFLMHYYLKLDTVPKDDKNEKLDNIEYDAFLCFWYVFPNIISVKNKDTKGFALSPWGRQKYICFVPLCSSAKKMSHGLSIHCGKAKAMATPD